MTTLLLVDGHNNFFRSYWGASKNKELSTTADVGTWGIYVALNTLLKYIKQFSPEYLCVVFDSGKSTYRTNLFPEYKKNRPKPDADTENELLRQLEVFQFLISEMEIPCSELPGVEADDVIAALAKEFKDKVDRVVVVSADHDLKQVVDDNVVLVKPSMQNSKEEVFDLQRIETEYKVHPSRLPELWSLTGDSGDGIIGIVGVGEKTAIKLIEKYGSLTALLHSDEEKILGHQGDATLAFSLIKALDLSVDVTLDQLRFKPDVEPKENVLELLKELEFYSIIQRWDAGNLFVEKKFTGGVRLS